MYKRNIDLYSLLKEASYFLFGPRATGKSSLIKLEFSQTKIFNLLDSDTYEELLRRPKALSEKINSDDKIIIIDEIQKLPKLLDEVHRIMEEKNIKFLLTGSSVRKLKSSGANMLGGRAREINLFPLTYSELNDFELFKYLNYGGLPIIWKSKSPRHDLEAYGRIYLVEEIKQEALVRNYERFVRFMETMALSNGQEINYQNLASDSGVPARTIEGYIEVLKDTLIAFELLPFLKSTNRKAVSKSKFYFFDCGVANYFSRRFNLTENHSDIGISFEQFIILEIRAYISYRRLGKSLTFWRSRDYEVDLIIDEEVAIEIKFSKTFKKEYLRGLKALRVESQISKYLVVGRFPSDGTIDEIEYYNFENFLTLLWSGGII
jgi:predicted AAA+ superfamily ATPase